MPPRLEVLETIASALPSPLTSVEGFRELGLNWAEKSTPADPPISLYSTMTE